MGRGPGKIWICVYCEEGFKKIKRLWYHLFFECDERERT